MRFLKIAGVICGALIVTALGIDATDTLRGADGTMLAQLIRSDTSACPKGMREVYTIEQVSCVDAYEAVPGPECPIQTPGNILETRENIAASSCAAASEEGRAPWRFVTREEARQLCARAGKRLPTSAEWYTLALGVPQQEALCNTQNRAVSHGGDFSECVSPEGVYDLIGNVWEWVSDDVIQGMYAGVPLPESGYVAQVDAQGVARIVHADPQESFGADYFWARADGVYGMIRGGYYDSGSDAGLYAVHADTVPTAAVPGVGFRCVR